MPCPVFGRGFGGPFGFYAFQKQAFGIQYFDAIALGVLQRKIHQPDVGATVDFESFGPVNLVFERNDGFIHTRPFDYQILLSSTQRLRLNVKRPSGSTMV